jgi:hypothetical protein
MARASNPGIRARLRDQAVDYVLSHGVGDLTRRPLARVLKTNARMLVYHFRLARRTDAPDTDRNT